MAGEPTVTYGRLWVAHFAQPKLADLRRVAGVLPCLDVLDVRRIFTLLLTAEHPQSTPPHPTGHRQ